MFFILFFIFIFPGKLWLQLDRWISGQLSRYRSQKSPTQMPSEPSNNKMKQTQYFSLWHSLIGTTGFRELALTSMESSSSAQAVWLYSRVGQTDVTSPLLPSLPHFLPLPLHPPSLLPAFGLFLLPSLSLPSGERRALILVIHSHVSTSTQVYLWSI